MVNEKNIIPKERENSKESTIKRLPVYTTENMIKIIEYDFITDKKNQISTLNYQIKY